jgi:hypothetical protein
LPLILPLLLLLILPLPVVAAVAVAVDFAFAVASAVVAVDVAVVVVVAVAFDPRPCPQPLSLSARSRHPAIFHLFQPPFHLLDDHLPRIRFQFELMLQRSLSCLNEREVRPHLVEQDFEALQVGPHLLHIIRIPLRICRRSCSLSSMARRRRFSRLTIRIPKEKKASHH